MGIMKMLGCIYVTMLQFVIYLRLHETKDNFVSTWTLNGMSRTAATDAKATQGQPCFGRAFGSLRLVLEVWLRKWRDRLISIIHNYRYYIDMEVESYSYRFILSFIITYSYHSSYILSPIILRPRGYSLIIIHIHTRVLHVIPGVDPSLLSPTGFNGIMSTQLSRTLKLYPAIGS